MSQLLSPFCFCLVVFFRTKTLEKTRTAIHSLTQMAPKSALKITDNGRTESVDIDDIDKGDHLLVKTDAQVPVDGVIDEGEGYLNEASVTGESQQRKKRKRRRCFCWNFF